MNESGMWKAYKSLISCLHPVRIEDRRLKGIPDVNYTDGWIENKYLPEYPKRATTLVRIEHFTAEQRAFHIERKKAGGRTFVMLRIADDWFLFKGYDAALVLGKLTKQQLYEQCLMGWEGLPNKMDLLGCLRC